MKKNFISRLNALYIFILIPLILFGFYKNGISLYLKGLIDALEMLKPLIILAMGMSGALLGFILKERKKGLKLDAELIIKSKKYIIEAILVVSILPLKSSPLIVFIVTLLFSLFLSNLKINRIALEYIVIESSNVLFGLNTFKNAYDATTLLNYDGVDLFFGLGRGGIFATSIILIAIGLVFLSFNKVYKKDLVYASLVTFLVLGIVPNMIMGEYNEILPFIFGYNVLFSLVLIAPNISSSSYTTKGQILSGVLIGIITYALSFWTPYTAVIIAIILVSLFKDVLDRIFVVK